MSDSPDNSVDQRIQDLYAKHSELYERGHYRSASRVSRELRQLAKAEGRIIPYLHANHQLMNAAQSLLEPNLGIEVAIDSIALLESEEKARLIQPNLPEDRYEYAVHRMSSCAYDNLAKHIANRDGYNSDGCHECIADGIQVCRRTGKLECINCFREYATDVYRASDDLEMAMHHARAVEQVNPRDDDDDDRRWVGARDQMHLHLVQGQLEAALDAAKRCWLLHVHYHAPLEAKFDTLINLEVIFWLMGKQNALQEFVASAGVEPVRGDEIPPGEFPHWDVKISHHNALRHACRGEFAEAIEVLTRLDQLLQARQSLDPWFEARLRLVSICLLAGETEKATRLAKQLTERAQAARDWLTLRRLKALQSGQLPPAPLPTVAPFTSGPFAPQKNSSDHGHQHDHDHGSCSDQDHDHDAPDSELIETIDLINSAEAAPPPPEQSPLLAWLESWFHRLHDTSTEEERQTIAFEILNRSASEAETADEAARLVHTAHVFLSQYQEEIRAWHWAQPFLAAFANDATLINVVASLGQRAREAAEQQEPALEPDNIVPLGRLEQLFRQSLDLDADRANNFVRAGQFYWANDRQGDAERCFARAFRLDRASPVAVMRLAEIYAATDRAQDALSVLDLSIREGCEDPAVFWQAAMTAINQSRYQVAASYLLQYETHTSEEQWVHYYLALCHLETARPVDALRSLDIEAERNPTATFATTALRACAAALGNNLTALREHLTTLLGLPLSQVNYLTQSGLSRLFERLYTAVLKLPQDDALRLQLELVGLQAGFAPDTYFDAFRQQGEAQDGESFYLVTLEQPLDATWPQSPGCLPGQEHWQVYLARWGVLAQDVGEAEQFARDWQSRCGLMSCNLLSIDLQGEGYSDKPGVVWQGFHIQNSDDA